MLLVIYGIVDACECDSMQNVRLQFCDRKFFHVNLNKSSAVAEMDDRGHNRHGPKRGGCCAPFAERWEPV